MKNKHHIKCGRHSGFSWCCILWYITIWPLILKYSKWQNGLIWYHKLIRHYRPKNKIYDLIIKYDYTQNKVIGCRKIEIGDWSMIPCPIHLITRHRSQIYTCFCLAWDPAIKAKVLKEHPELCVKD
jgi:hypothetical protein